METITKRLSANDLGLTGGHQSGILVPKKVLLQTSLFPELSQLEKNPRLRLEFTLRPSGELVFLNFIYYNSIFFGGTRNEFRLTGLSPLLRRIGAQTGDLLKMSELHGKLYIEHEVDAQKQETKHLVLTGEWAIHG